ncbi:MAG: serine/threonine protein kinase, partial [Planctomycetales bacterium]|nr:serine/threonine protein kinase [Planctomycetales bacterium]
LALGLGISAVVLATAFYIVSLLQYRTEAELRDSRLTTGLNATVLSVELWMERERQQIELLARDPEVRACLAELSSITRDAQVSDLKDKLLQADAQARLRRQIHATFGEAARYAIWDRQFMTLADWSSDGNGVGDAASPSGAALLTRVFAGETVIRMPGAHEPITANYVLPPDRSRVSVIAPVRDDSGRVGGALLLFGLGAAQRLEELLEVVRVGKTGETYAFDKNGRMISESRFHDSLVAVGLLEREQSASGLLLIRDPGGELTAGFRPRDEPAAWPLTKMAQLAVQGRDGVDLDGYRNYLGAEVIGAWHWFPDAEFGIALEVQMREMRGTLRWMRLETNVLLLMLGLSFLGIVLSLLRLRRLRANVVSNRQLGQYRLVEKIGEGGMATVYRASHALLKRPTAIKILKAEIANRRTLAWFEREVQLVSHLRHPNTIVVYDYGVTPGGLLYYVMEFLEGKTLGELVAESGPISVSRTLHLLEQALGALREAHQVGVVHRDIKPQNLMVCQCGGEVDFLKVLDFGLVKQIVPADQAMSTVLAGTPRYMAPERLLEPQENDPRSDLYALGAVAYYLLSGQEIYAEVPAAQLLTRILQQAPAPLAQVASQPI